MELETIWASFIPFGDIIGVTTPGESSGSEFSVHYFVYYFSLSHAEPEHRRIVFIEYETPEDAKAAVENMNGSEICGKPINVKIALPLYGKKEATSEK